MYREDILSEDDYRLFRENISLLEEQVTAHFPECYADHSILTAIRKVPRHLFVNESYRYLAYTDNALPTYGGMTTSAPSVIARMIFCSGIREGDKILEIGTGTGYQAAVLAEMKIKVFSMEIDRQLHGRAKKILGLLGYTGGSRGVELYAANGQYGLPEHQPFKAIIVAASVAYRNTLSSMVSQLSESDGRMVVPVGPRHEQSLLIIERKGQRVKTSVLQDATFDFVRLIQRG